MDRNKQIGMVFVRNRGAPAVIDIVVAAAHQHRAHALFGVDARRELFRNRECDVLLPGPVLADRAGVVATVARVDRDHDVTPGRIAL